MASPRLDTDLEQLLEHLPDTGPAVLATVVRTAGSTYRKPGARMLILPGGRYWGLLSGGCLEGDLTEHAAAVMQSGVPRAVEYDTRGPDDALFGLGSGCEGAMRILLEPAGVDTPARRALLHVGRASAAGQAASIAVVHDARSLLGTRPPEPSLPEALQRALSDALATRSSSHLSTTVDGAPALVWVHYLAPPPHLLLCGAGPDAQPVARLARELGWRVTVVDHRPAYASAARFPGARVACAPAVDLAKTVDLATADAVVVMSHHLTSDASYLSALASAGPAYVGLLGPKARRARLLEDLGPSAQGLDGRLRGPVGLDLGATTPEAIALSIIGEILANFAGRPGGPTSRPAPA